MLTATCHCNAIKVEVPREPESVTDCNCSTCRRYGALWAYYKDAAVTLHFSWNDVSVIAGPTRTNCLFRLHEGSIKKEEIVEFLKALKAHLKPPLMVILDEGA